MRLWSVHPRFLDSRGLVALWREGLLAQKVLAGGTRGYRNHPQLTRFRAARDPLAAIGAYLVHVEKEASRRNYRFDRSRIVKPGKARPLPVTRGQLRYETLHLIRKLKSRDQAMHSRYCSRRAFSAHPSFRVVSGPVESWEKTS